MYKILKEDLDKKTKNELDFFLNMNENIFNTKEWNERGVSDAESYIRYNYEYDLEQLKIKYLEKTDSNAYYWIGINPYKKGEDVSMSELYYSLADFLDTRSWGDNYMYTVEAHTKEGYRVHAHLILITKQKKYRILEQLSKYLKIDKNFIDIKKHSIDLDKRINYIMGDKQINKESLCELDRAQREIEGISNYINKLKY